MLVEIACDLVSFRVMTRERLLLQLVRLPKRETVNDVLQKYSDHVTKTDPDRTK